jgi:hypothetical protein
MICLVQGKIRPASQENFTINHDWESELAAMSSGLCVHPTEVGSSHGGGRRDRYYHMLSSTSIIDDFFYAIPKYFILNFNNAWEKLRMK